MSCMTKLMMWKMTLARLSAGGMKVCLKMIHNTGTGVVCTSRKEAKVWEKMKVTKVTKVAKVAKVIKVAKVAKATKVANIQKKIHQPKDKER